MSTPVPPCAAAIAGATSPSRMRFTFAPASRSSAISASCRSRSSTTTEISRGVTPFASATARMFSVGDALMSTTSMPCGPTAIFSMYTAASGKNIVPRSASAITAIAFGWPSAVSRVPSSGSTATSTSGPVPSPTRSPLKSIGASSFSPSPMTTTPSIETESSIARIASTAAWSAASLSPRPTQRPAPIAADSVTRTSSSARLRSGRTGAPGLPLCSCATAMRGFLHPLGSLDPDEVETAGDHALRRPDKRQPKGLLVAFEHAVLRVEPVEVVGDADRIDRDRLGPPPFRCFRRVHRKLREALDQVAFLGRERGFRRGGNRGRAGPAQDPGDPGMRVLDVIDRVLLGPLGRQVDVDVDRLVGAAVDEVPAGRVHADLVHEVVQEDDVAAPLRHLPLLAAARQVDELVDQHLYAFGVVAEHAGDRRVPVPRAVVVGTEHVDRPVEAALELVGQVDDVRGPVGRPAALLRRANEHPVLVVAVHRRAGPDRSVLLVRVETRQELVQVPLELALLRPAVEVDPEAVERLLDLLQHSGDRVSRARRELVDVGTPIAVLGWLLPAPPRLHGGPELLHLRAGVVVV